MKVLFSNPPWWLGPSAAPGQAAWVSGVRAGSRWPAAYPAHSSPDRFRFGDYLPYPFFLGYAASYARAQTGAEIHFRDSIALRDSYDRYYRQLVHERYDYVFIETSSPSWDHDQQVLLGLHRLCPHTRIVVTGPVAATRAHEILERHPVYACIKGEYDKASVRVIQGASGVVDFDLMTQDEMNAAPFPHYDDLHAKRYWDCNPPGQVRPHAQIWSSRGCPYKCIFCVWPATMTGNDPDGAGVRKVRYYTPEYLEAFISELLDRYHYKCIYFDDDTFNLGDRHVRGVCEVMARLGVPWAAMCRADTVGLATWRVMKESGCFGVKIGFESGNQWVLDHIVKKNLDLERSKAVLHEIKRLGMTVHGTFTVGLPGETEAQMQETLRFAGAIPLDSLQISGAATIEGTPLHTLQQRGSLEGYAGAVVGDELICQADGNAKFVDIFERSQRSFESEPATS